MPCVACLQLWAGCEWGGCGPIEVHHLISGNKRRGHLFTIPLGAYHHRGVRPMNFTQAGTVLTFGPSLALNSKIFRERFGSDDELLARTNKLLEAL
jgi:hypothetical protein